MGYYTRYELDVDGDSSLIAELLNNNEEASYALCENGDTEESCKWYNHEIAIKEFSKKHPDTIFKLSGVGEESPDLWVKYFKDGKMQVCTAVITYDAFDESKLS